MDPELVFLTYLPRSGSTWLAQWLDAFPDLAVTTEAVFFDGLVEQAFHPAGPRQLDRYLDILYGQSEEAVRRCPKTADFRHWGVDRDALSRSLSAGGFPVPFSAVLPAAAKLYATERSAATTVYKNGDYIFHVDRIREQFPQAKVLFVQRDPRAIYNSQKQAIHSVRRVPMCRNPVYAALRFCRTARVVRQFASEPWFHVVRFERLISGERSERERLLAFLNVATVDGANCDGAAHDSATVDHTDQDVVARDVVPVNAAPERSELAGSSYHDRIPPYQRHLHRRVAAEPQVSRIDAWRDSLSDIEIGILETIAGCEMERLGYGRTLSSWKAGSLSIAGGHYFGIRLARSLARMARSFVRMARTRMRRQLVLPPARQPDFLREAE